MNMHMPHPLFDRESYNKSLRTTLDAKLFFVDKIPLNEVGMFVDFGCADGSLLEALDLKFDSTHYPALCGVDRDPQQRELAARKCLTGVYPTLSQVPAKEPGVKSCLILSSVLHEVLSEVTGPVFWAMVELLDFDYIVIRDYALDEKCYAQPTPLDWNLKLFERDEYHARMADMVRKYGSLRELHNFMHFLLKYPYRENWTRELAENYVPYSSQAMASLFTESGMYEITHWQPTTTAHFKERVERDFGITKTPTTHIEMVLERRT